MSQFGVGLFHFCELCREYTDTFTGRVSSTRIAGKALVFLDVYQEGCFLQGVCNGQRLGSWNGTTPEEFRQFSRLLRRGDVICECWAIFSGLLDTDHMQLLLGGPTGQNQVNFQSTPSKYLLLFHLP